MSFCERHRPYHDPACDLCRAAALARDWLRLFRAIPVSPR